MIRRFEETYEVIILQINIEKYEYLTVGNNNVTTRPQQKGQIRDWKNANKDCISKEEIVCRKLTKCLNSVL